MLPKPIPILNKAETKRFLEIDAKPLTLEELEEGRKNVELFLSMKIRK